MEGIENPEVIVQKGMEYLRIPVRPGQGPCSGCIFSKEGTEEESLACFSAPWCGYRFVFVSARKIEEGDYEN